MTEDIYSMPDMTKKEKTDRGEMEERIVDIYISADTLRGHDPSSEAEDPTPEKRAEDQCSGAKSPERRLSRVAAVCLGLLCVLLLAGVIGLAVIYTEQIKETNQLNTSYNNVTRERDHLRTSNTILTRERDQLNTSYTILTRERDQLNTSNTILTRKRDQLNTSYTILTKERDQLNTSNTILTREREQLNTSNTILTRERDQMNTSNTILTRERHQMNTSNIILTREKDQLNTSNTILTRERDDLKKRLCENTPGWIRFGCSCYYVSTEQKNWGESRQDCRDRGADLVVINTREEENFLLSFKKRMWIGLTDIGREGNWTWVDGTPLTTGYWITGDPNGDNTVNCADLLHENWMNLDGWYDSNCNDENYWVCEKVI